MENKPQKDNSRTVLALVLIGIGMIWVLRRIGIYYHFPEIYWNHLFFPFREVFHNVGHFIFSWPMLLIIIGLIFLAGRRSSGIVLIVIGGLFLLPRMFFFPHFTISLILPVLLIGVGVAMVARVL